MKRATLLPAVFLLAPFSAYAQTTYVLNATTWGSAQDAAVSAAGGVVSFKHDATGIGIVTSSDPNFLTTVQSSTAFEVAAVDMTRQWIPPQNYVEVDDDSAAVTPLDETFIHLQWNLLAIDAAGAWARGFDGTGVRVAILDGGIHSSHNDLVNRLDVPHSASFVPGVPFNQDVGTFWHGTHVAGIVAASDNGLGTIGVAPGATLIGVKVLHAGSGSFSWLIQGILYASTPIAQGGAGADIINMSLGGTFAIAGGEGPLVAALNEAVNYAGDHGVLVISSAGNDAIDLDHSRSLTKVPAQSGSGIAVSATGPVGFGVQATNFRRPASYTNYGVSLVDVAGPGGDFVYPRGSDCQLPRADGGSVIQPCWVFDGVISPCRGVVGSTGTYCWASGTSMATPAVAGVAALVKQKYPNASPGELKNRIFNSADDEGKKGVDAYYGRGFVNARKAVMR